MAEFNPNATFQTPVYVDDNDYGCRWLARQFGGPDNSNTILPTLVRLVCGPGYTTVQGQCVPIPDYNFEAHCDDECGGSPQAGTPQVRAGHPISVNSGYKLLEETDYASADGLLTVERNYLSRGTDGWKTLFPGFLTMGSGFYNVVEFHSRKGGTDQFVSVIRNDYNNWAWTLPNLNGSPRSYSRRRLSMVSTPSVTRNVWQADTNVSANGPAEMRLDMANGEYILFRRVNDATFSLGLRLLAPVEHGLPGGFKRWFDYDDDSPHPYQIRDSLNRVLALNWQDAPGNIYGTKFPVGKVVSRINLPDGTRLDYAYDKAENPTAPPPEWALSQNLDIRTVSEATGAITSAISTSNIIYHINYRRDRLRSVTRNDAQGTQLWQRSYDYAGGFNAYNLTGIKDQNGATLAAYNYTGNGRLAGSVLAGGLQPYSFEHLHWYENNIRNYWQQARRVTGPLGRTDEYHLFRRDSARPNEPAAIARVEGKATPTTPADVQRFEYASTSSIMRLMTRSYDQEDRQTSYVLDYPKGRHNGMTEAVGTPAARTTTMQWHPTLDLPTRVERDGLRVDTTYTADAMVASQTLTDLTTHTAPYSTNGQTRTTTYTWGPNARLLSANGPRPVDAQGKDDIVTFAYDTAGNVTSMTNGLGHITTFAAYDANGRPGSMTDPNGVVTEFTYDLLGRTTSVRVKHPTSASEDAVTSFAYDIEGRVTSITAPASSPLTMVYDLAGQLKSVVAANGERIDYDHDAMGNVTAQAVKRADASTASSITRTFDALGRMLTETLGPGRTWTYAYDKVGNITGIASPRNQSTAQSFDALDRLVASAMPDGGAPTLAYDKRDNVTLHGDAIGVQTSLVRNAFGEAVREISPDRGTSIYYYNSAGDMSAAIDGRGQRIDYAYDILGRLTSATPLGRPASETVTYTWDSAALAGSFAIGRLSRVEDSGTTVEYGYDHRGNVTTKRQRIDAGPWLTLGFEYDLADRRTQISYPTGRIVHYSYDLLGRTTQVRTKAAASDPDWTLLADGMSYEAFGALTQANYGNGLRMIQSWGNDGRLANRRLERTADSAALSSLTYAYDNSDNITQIADTLDSSKTRSFGYDPVERLTRMDGAVGSFVREDYLHDDNGNRLLVERRATVAAATPAETDSYSIAPGTNRLTSIATPAGTRSFTHDARGNLAGETRPAGSPVTVAYDGRARLTSYSVGTATQTMLYNGADERIRVITTPASGPVDTRQFVYDLDHRIVGEYGAGGATDLKAEYIWTLSGVGSAGPTGGDDGTGGYTPLAVAVGVAGQSGITSEIQWVHASHLGTPILTTNAAGQAVTPYGYAAIGFPGQFANALLLPGAEHYYNRYRDYDPTTGRYIQADPIGLAGDENAWVYALGNPLRYTDPTGELVPQAVGGLIGAGLEWWTNPCATATDIIMAGALGAVGGGLGKLALLRHGSRALTREIGKEWSHSIPRRVVNNLPQALRGPLNRRGGLNGSWVTPKRHFKHDPHRNPVGSGNGGMGQRLHPALQKLDRIPDWMKASGGAGLGGAIVSANSCAC